jgi:hypothetical protein
MIAALHDAAMLLGVEAPELTIGSGKAFEARVLFALALAARPYFLVEMCDHTGACSTGGIFRLRGGPGHLPSPVAAGLQPTYFLLTAGGHPFFELHNSLQFRGASGGLHEVDISALATPEANAVRHGPAPRAPAGPPLIGVELKEYVAEVDKNLVRAFFACIVDFVPLWPVEQLSLGGGPGFRRAFIAEERRGDQFWFLTTGSLSQPTKDFADFYDIRTFDGLTGSAIDAAVQHVARPLLRAVPWFRPTPNLDI